MCLKHIGIYVGSGVRSDCIAFVFLLSTFLHLFVCHYTSRIAQVCLCWRNNPSKEFSLQLFLCFVFTQLGSTCPVIHFLFTLIQTCSVTEIIFMFHHTSLK